MPRIEFTDEARADLRSIVTYTAQRWSPAQAHRYIDGLEAVCGQLAAMPRMGKRTPDLGEALRCFPYESHVLYYRPTENGVVVVAVVHKRQNPALRLGD